MKFSKRFFSLILSLAIIVSSICVDNIVSFADDECLHENFTVTISDDNTKLFLYCAQCSEQLDCVNIVVNEFNQSDNFVSFDDYDSDEDVYFYIYTYIPTEDEVLTYKEFESSYGNNYVLVKATDLNSAVMSYALDDENVLFNTYRVSKTVSLSANQLYVLFVSLDIPPYGSFNTTKQVVNVCGDWSYLIDDDTCTIVKYSGNDTEIVIPSELDGYTVVGVDYGTFSNSSSITKVVIPLSVSNINGLSTLVNLQEFCVHQSNSFDNTDSSALSKIESIISYHDWTDLCAENMVIDSDREDDCMSTDYVRVKCSVCNYRWTEYHIDEPFYKEHEYELISDTSTCLEAGKRTYKCAHCTKSYTESVSSCGHNYEVISDTSTCTEQGVRVSKCSFCGDIKEEFIDNPQHTWDNGVIIKEPTCTETGLKQYVCAACGETKDEVLDCIKHHYVRISGCEDLGTSGYFPITYKCDMCGNIKTQSNYYNSYSGKLFDYHTDLKILSVDTSRFCVATYVCGDCGFTFTDEYNRMHDYEIIESDVSCGSYGYVTKRCVKCGEISRGGTSVEHNYEIIDKSPAFCDIDGYEILRCKICDNQITRELPKLDHPDYYWVEYEPSCTKPRRSVSYCCCCNEVMGESYDNSYGNSALGHDYVTVSVAPTCTEDGYAYQSCSRCNDVQNNHTILPATGHNYQIAERVNAICSMQGKIVYVCTVCGDSFTTVLPIIPHNYIVKELISVDFDRDGAVVYQCKDCKNEYTAIVEKAWTVPVLSNVKNFVFSKKSINNVSLKWDKVSGADGYIVYVNKDGSGWKQFKTVTTNTLSFKPTSGSQYKFYVKAYVKSHGKYFYSDNSNVLTYNVPLKTPTIKSLSMSGKKLIVKSSVTSQATAWQIQYSTNSKFNDSKTVTVSKGSNKTITSLKSNTRYYVRIRACRKVIIDGKAVTIYSSWSSVKNVK